MTQKETSTTPTTEIVTFRVTGTPSTEDVARAAADMAPFLDRTGGCLSRVLSVDADGLWTDHIVWTSRDAAERAAAEMPGQPESAAFMALIDPQSVTMRHADLCLKTG